MNWGRVLTAGVVAGVVVNLVDFVLHGVIMAETYKKYDTVFTQTQANPAYFFAAAIAIGIFVAILFAKTRASWAEGWKGGMTFGLWFGLATFFFNFYSPLVIADFPYYLAWCWGGIGLIDSLVGGSVIGAIIKR
jgi:hypothetical protein